MRATVQPLHILSLDRTAAAIFLRADVAPASPRPLNGLAISRLCEARDRIVYSGLGRLIPMEK